MRTADGRRKSHVFRPILVSLLLACGSHAEAQELPKSDAELGQLLSGAMGPRGLSKGTQVTVRACEMTLVTDYDRSCPNDGGIVQDTQVFDLTELFTPPRASIGERLPDRTPVRWTFRPDVLEKMEDVSNALKQAFPLTEARDTVARNALAKQLMKAGGLGSYEEMAGCSGTSVGPPIIFDLGLLVASDRVDEIAEAVTSRLRMCTAAGAGPRAER